MKDRKPGDVVYVARFHPGGSDEDFDASVFVARVADAALFPPVASNDVPLERCGFYFQQDTEVVFDDELGAFTHVKDLIESHRRRLDAASRRIDRRRLGVLAGVAKPLTEYEEE